MPSDKPGVIANDLRACTSEIRWPKIIKVHRRQLFQDAKCGSEIGTTEIGAIQNQLANHSSSTHLSRLAKFRYHGPHLIHGYAQGDSKSVKAIV